MNYLEFDVSELESLLATCKKNKLVSAYVHPELIKVSQGGGNIFRFSYSGKNIDVGGSISSLLEPVIELKLSAAQKLRVIADELELDGERSVFEKTRQGKIWLK